MLNDDDLNRYARQVIIPNFEEDGQENLLNTKCLILGAGGLGCPVALYASAAGFGHIEIYDEDIIEISNLNRQIAHKNDQIGNNKDENLYILIEKLISSMLDAIVLDVGINRIEIISPFSISFNN